MSQNFYGGGGGFLGDSPAYGSQGSPGGSTKRATSSSLRPVTIKQLRDATQAHTDAEWVIEGYDVSAITLVAQAVQVNPQETNCTYTFDDGTGIMEGRRWADNKEEDEQKWGVTQHNDVVRVSGQIKSFGGKKSINVQHMRPIKDPHEIYFHLLEVVTVTLAIERGPPGKPSQNGHSGAVSGGPSAYSAQSSAVAVNSQYSHLPDLPRRIIEYISTQPPAEEGVHVAGIARAIGGDAISISQALDILMDEGHVYTTIDESHFRISQ